MKLLKIKYLIRLAVSSALLAHSALAEQTSANYRITNQVLPAGGGYQTATSYSLASVIGQSSPLGESAGTNYLFAGGFLAGRASAQPVDLSMIVSASTICRQEPFDVTFKVAATPGQPVGGVHLFLKFDPAVLKVNKISNGTALDFVARKEANKIGYLNFASSSFINAPPTSTFELMTVNFTPLQNSGGTVLQVDANNSNLQSQGNFIPLKAEDTTLVIGDCLKGRVKLQGRPAKPHKSWITALDIHTTEIQSVVTDNRGLCYLPITVTPGNHSFCVKNSHTLANKVGPPISANKIIDLGTLLEGDANDDNKIDLKDMYVVKETLNKCAGQTDYNANADFNVDGCVNNKDIAVAFGNGDGGSSNFGRRSTCSLDSATGTLRKGRRGEREGDGSVTLTTNEIPTKLAVGESFDLVIQVNAGESQPIDGSAVYLNFAPNSLQVNQLTAGEQFDFVLQKEFDNSKGEINFAANSWTTAVPQGTFTLVTINFTLLEQNGAETLAFNTTEHRQTAAVSGGETVTTPENVGQVAVEKIVDNGEPVVEDDGSGGEEEPTEEEGEEEATYTTSGIILDQQGNPVAGVTIQVGNSTVITDANGAWEINELAAGDYTVTASKAGYTFESTQINLSGGQTSQQVNLAVLTAPKTYKASGTIKDRQGNPVAGVLVEIGEHTQLTDANGYWQIEGLPEGDYSVMASKEGYHFPTEQVAIGNDQDTTLNWQADSVLDVKVVATPRIAKQGEKVTYTITVTNQGKQTATGVNLAEVLPANTQLDTLEALDGGVCDANALTCDLLDLTPGATANIKLVISNNQAATLLNTVTVTAQEYPSEVKKTRTSVIPYLSVNITDSPDPVPMLNVLHYTIAVELSEYAPSDATGVTLVSTLPQGVELKSINTDDGVCDTSQLPQITCQMNDLSVASADSVSRATVAMEVELTDAGLLLLTHEAKVTANEYAAHENRERTRIFIPEEVQVDISLVIDVTGSMQEEINGVINALQAFIAKIDISQSPLMALITFGDEVKVTALTRDLEVLRGAVKSLTANGGGTCPEAAVEALSVALQHTKDGGDMLFSTDASPYPDADVESVVKSLDDKAIKFNALITGDCTMKESWNQLPE